MNNRDKRPDGHSIPKTLSQSIYNYLKESIINNKLKANQRINDKEIASIFGISTTPVREAILRLGAEGFVTINSHREALVREISFNELKEIFQVLAHLDSLASSLALNNLSPEKIKEIERLTKEMEKHCHRNSIETYMDLNVDVHKKIWESIPNRFLQSVLQHINNQMLRYNNARFYAFQKHRGALEKSMADHKEILKALKNKDKRKIRSLLLKHWGSILKPSPFEKGLKEYLIKE
ncbi:MAG: GntR family transcriptional regulator [Candidatus Aminicenantes bacterium]|nr:GntR family transcriptional regulator [Candidatus Aminicenantes bacterium]MDH5383648.1 GntR family transcriptional regulator [Candidatus Aminicenantes bacterium]MDH5744602.1 GntR family transcriptional regulator [Candidatus Aminicenantes bacterium]